MRYVDLSLKRIDKEKDQKGDKKYLFDEAVKEGKINIILGTPGSGKTSLLKKFESNNEDVQFITVKKFLKLNKKVDPSIQILLLDGLDEYRSISDDKMFVVDELGDRISSLLEDNNNLKIAVSCREMDWYGDTD